MVRIKMMEIIIERDSGMQFHQRNIIDIDALWEGEREVLCHNSYLLDS